MEKRRKILLIAVWGLFILIISFVSRSRFQKKASEWQKMKKIALCPAAIKQYVINDTYTSSSQKL